ncbi:hypothetical protein ACLM5J_04690 [Nocardioides sp. Bht2]|uniref:hypothetical protein n=1 Tax=Nocardioides sp. Bht2 TaxID=3392297 RepID=UPI0039B5056B
MDVMLFFVLLSLATILALFWLIRLAVRYGVNDALQMNRSWLRSSDEVRRD